MPKSELLSHNITVEIFNNRQTWVHIKSAHFCPVRKATDGTVVVLYNSKALPLYRGASDNFYVFLDTPTYLYHNVQIPKKRPSIDKVQFYAESLSFLYYYFSGKIPLIVQKKQFGTYAFLDCDENLVERLLLDMELSKLFKVISWEDVDYVENQAISHFSWRIKFSTAINEHLLLNTLLHFFTEILKDTDLKSTEKTLKSELQLTPTMHDIKNANLSTDGKKKSREISKDGAYKTRVSNEFKFVRDLIFISFPRLALYPQSAGNIIETSTKYVAISKVLKNLDVGNDYRFKKLGGLAGKAGWREVAEHIEDGHSKRLRVYFRKATKINDCIEIYIDAKKDDKDQKRTLTYISKLSPAFDRAIIYQ